MLHTRLHDSAGQENQQLKCLCQAVTDETMYCGEESMPEATRLIQRPEIRMSLSFTATVYLPKTTGFFDRAPRQLNKNKGIRLVDYLAAKGPSNQDAEVVYNIKTILCSSHLKFQSRVWTDWNARTRHTRQWCPRFSRALAVRPWRHRWRCWGCRPKAMEILQTRHTLQCWGCRPKAMELHLQ
jgi:hypothetical protein